MTHPATWRNGLISLGISLGAVGLLFATEIVEMTRLWWTISTYQHCLFVLPIIGWLVWLRRAEVVRITPAGWWPGLALVLAAGLVWLVGQAGGIALLRHAGVIMLVQASVVAILGPNVARALLFPLFYLIFLVPFGDELTAPMQTLTADMTMRLLAASGVPATLDGVFITTRAGWFEVAEACAGVKFLVAMIAYGALAANLCFRTTTRRVLFMAAAIVVPVLANGVRAWATIVAAEHVGVAAATGFDHIVYGWVFFAVVMVVIMGVAWPFFDRRVGDRWVHDFVPLAARSPVSLMAPVVLLVAALAPAWDAAAGAAGRVALPNAVVLPVVPGWLRTGDAPAIGWRPRFDGADHVLIGRYGDARGQRVDVAVALYGWQGAGREIIGYGQGAVDPDGVWAWSADLPALDGARRARLMGPGKAEREAVTWWFVGDRRVATTTDVRLATLRARLTGGNRSAATLIVSAQGPDAEIALAAFSKALGDPEDLITRMFAQARGR